MDADSALTETDRSSNPNIAWMGVLVDELARCGLRAVCIAPGSRSTPLTLVFEAHPAIRVFRHLDERSAAFFALGMAMAKDEPVALVCTSGTAAANFFPAVIEARHSQVPLLVLTSDRPHELRHSGANQTIDQVKLYGDQVLWSVDLPVPAGGAPPLSIRHLRTTAARAYALANGLVKGAVHLNLPFRKPLEPDGRDEPGMGYRAEAQRGQVTNLQPPTTRFWQGKLIPSDDQVGALATIIEESERGLIICGPRCPGSGFPAAVGELSRLSGFPILADPLSGVRFGDHVADGLVIGGYDTFLQDGMPAWSAPDVVIRFGGVPTSNSLNRYLDGISGARRLHISHNGVWADDSHRVNDFVQVDPVTLCRLVAKRLPSRPFSEWTEAIRATESRCWEATQDQLPGEFFDGGVVAEVVAALPPGARLFAGNSLPVRHLDQFGKPRTIRMQILANRGASGIDGNISSALGAGAAGDAPLVAILGDITFYHDMNGLLAVKGLGLKITIVLLNNNGGGIFRRLPISRFEPPFTELFLTPHGLEFEPAIRMYGLDYDTATDYIQLREALHRSMEDSVSRVIEVRTDSARDHAVRMRLMTQVRQRISGE